MRLTALLACCSALMAADPAEKPIKHTEIPGMSNFIGLKYLPDDRYSGDAVSPRGDYEMLLSLHVPKEGTGPFPVVIYVHGGAYTSYNKEGQTELAKELAGRGIAFCGFNYTLLPKGIFPQCWWDFRNAVRFLRKNADKFQVDPLRIGAYGISAGGWLISSASMPNGDYAASRMQGGSVHLPSFFANNNGKSVVKNQDDEWAWLKPIGDPAPAWRGESGAVSALSWDFCYFVERGDSASPAIQQWSGQGAAKPGYAEAFVASGGRLTITELTDQKFAGKGVHVPPFFNRGGGKGEADALDLDGKPGKTLGVVIADFFQREFRSPSARAPAPEVLPVPHLISGPTPVTLVAPRGATIRYTTDGSAPTATSPAYQAPFSVTPGTTVKAVTIAPGMQPSGAIKAEFINGTPAPKVIGPESLPPGETGKAYSVTFSANQPKVRWNMQGDLVARVPNAKKNTVYSKDDYMYPNHMRLDADTGTWSGTPTKPGVFWIQVWVAEGPGMLAGYRNFRWTVSGKDLGDQAPAAAEAADRNQVFATLKHWPAEPATALLDAFSAAKLRVVTPGKAGDPALMLVVHADDRAKAEAVLKEFSAKRPELVISSETAKP